MSEKTDLVDYYAKRANEYERIYQKPERQKDLAVHRKKSLLNTSISRTDAEGNTYQLRRLENGDKHEVLKNFPCEKEVREMIAGLAVEISWTELQYYWFLKYKLK
jgi:hypothetical protein